MVSAERTLEQTNTIIQALTMGDILKVYAGRPGCACGCNGKYRVTATSRTEADTDRGYPYNDDEVDPRYVTKVLRQVQLNAIETAGEWLIDDGLYYISVEPDPRHVFTVYLTKEARANWLRV